MNSTRKVVRRVAAGVAMGCLVFVALGTWNKHDFCQGWANHYAREAAQRRHEAAEPGVGEEQHRDLVAAANLAELISRKYAAVARQPWRSYPGFPLVSPEEMRSVTEGKSRL